MLDVLGVYWYHNKQLEQAKAALEKAVDLLTRKNEYKCRFSDWTVQHQAHLLAPREWRGGKLT